MDTAKYQVLLSAIETGSYSAAAEKCGYTVSGISRMISSLEEETCFPLLVRGKTGVLPTAECKELLPDLKAFIQQADLCQQKINAIRGLETGTVRIGTAYSTFYKEISEITAEFHQSHPGIVIQIRNGYSTELATAMDHGELDICMISKREHHGTWLPLFENEILAAVPENDPLAKESSVPITAFATHPYIETYPQSDNDNTRAFHTHRIRPNIQFTTVDSYATRSMVEAGLGISLNNQLNTMGWDQHGIVMLPVTPRLPVEIGIAVGEHCTKAVQIYLEQLYEKIKKRTDH